MICLATGAVLDAAMGPHAGKGHSELGLFRTLGVPCAPGMCCWRMRCYCNYFMIATLQAAGVDVLFEQNGSRASPTFAAGSSLAKRDHLVRWQKPTLAPDWMTRRTIR